MIYLAHELSKFEDLEVIYVAECEMVPSRIAFGWDVNLPPNSNFIIANDKYNVNKILDNSPRDSIHICQGFRSFGIQNYVQDYLKKHNLKYWIIAESIAINGLIGVFKSFYYFILILLRRNLIIGYLAIGNNANQWFINKSLRNDQIFPFGYFLSDDLFYEENNLNFNKIKLIFVGQLIQRKRLDLLFEALFKCNNSNIELTIVGSGILENKLKIMSANYNNFNIIWRGNLRINEIKNLIKESNCLILPSDFDGWGAVTIESLMLGTNVICSSKCGSAEVVKNSPFGLVFESGNVNDLTNAINKIIDFGIIDHNIRIIISNWSRKLGARSGAKYLYQILTYNKIKKKRPIAPWINSL
jgi:glycosyltransferase involved in cell wall biosynthesis